MKIAVECKSPLLQKALEMFLTGHLSSAKQCDIFICDIECLKKDERCFYISQDSSSDLIKPFSKTMLLLALESKYKQLGLKEEFIETKNDLDLDFSILEKRIDSLTQEYKENILRAVKAFYE